MNYLKLSFLIIIAIIYLQFINTVIGQENQNNFGWDDEAGALVIMVQDHFTCGADNWQDAKIFHVVVLGDSIAWGEGLNQSEKYYYLVADWLQREIKRPVEVTVLAHDGATLEKPTKIKKDNHYFLDPELGSWDPTLFEQADHIPNPEDVDLILLSGGINDVEIGTILSPLNNSDDISTRCVSVGNSMHDLLIKLLKKCSNSTIIVTSYYTIASEDTPQKAIDMFTEFITKNDPNWTEKLLSPLISINKNDILKNSARFNIQSRNVLGDTIGGAVYDANTFSRNHFSKDRVYFAAVDFPSYRSYGTVGSWLWELIDTKNGGKTNDHKYADRVALCHLCNWDDKIQAMGHPNVYGAQQYYSAIQKSLKKLLPDFGANSNPNGRSSSFEPGDVDVVGSASPTVQAFQVTPQSLTLGESFSIKYTVSDSSGLGLKQVELRRKYETSDFQEINTSTLADKNSIHSGTFTDSPSAPGKYWYGLDVVDNAGNKNDEFWMQDVQVVETEATGSEIPTNLAIIRASIWTVNETGPMGNCPGTWIRRQGTNTFDASWSCEGGVTDVIDITSVEGNKITLHRRGINGDYTGTISPDGTSISGTGSWFRAGQKWFVSVST